MTSPDRPSRRRGRVVCLLSGSGTTMQNLVDRSADGRWPHDVVGVIASRPEAGGVARAEAAGIPCAVVPRRDHPKGAAGAPAHSRAVFEALEPWEPDAIALCGWLNLLDIPDAWEHRILNVHPALLPDFGGKGMYGDRVHAAVLESDATESGCTVHYVDAEYDHGPVILQRRVPVEPGDTVETLRERVMAAERDALPAALDLHLTGRLEVRDGRVHVLDGEDGVPDGA